MFSPNGKKKANLPADRKKMPSDVIIPFQDQPRAPYPTRTDITKNNPETKQSPQSEGSSIGFSFQNLKKNVF